jgi:hypothetical protein
MIDASLYIPYKLYSSIWDNSSKEPIMPIKALDKMLSYCFGSNLFKSFEDYSFT